MPRRSLLLLALLPALLFCIARRSHAQTWVETPSLVTAPYVAYAGPGFYITKPIFIRSAQQPMIFDMGSQYLEARVRVTSPTAGAWQTLYRATGGGSAYGVVQWPGVPTAVGVYDIEFQWKGQSGDWTSPFIYRLYVAPAAHRAFSDGQQNTMVMWQGTTPAIDSPFLAVEGIDAENLNNPASYYFSGLPLFNTGRERGADVLILDFAQGGADMRTNAGVVERAINYLNAIRTGTRRLDVAGLSMGGVVTRYALARMEHYGRAHNVQRFVSVDAPQQGAWIDLSLQTYVFMNVPESEWPPNLISTAGKQLLQFNLFDNYGLHESFFSELNALNGDGYPHQTVENVGVSFGTPNPNPNVGQRWLRTYDNVYFPGSLPDESHYVEQGNREALPGSYLPEDIGEVWVKRFGFVEVNFTRHSNPTFIPYLSALDIRAGASRFAVRFQANEPSFHNVVPPEIVEPLLARLGYPRPPLTASFTGPTSLRFGQSGTWTNTSTGGTAPHRPRWDYFIPCAPPPPPPCNPHCTEGGDDLRVEPPGGLRPAAPPDEAVLGEQCDVWLDGGTANTSTKTFSYAPTGSVRIRLSVSDSGDPVQSGQRTQTVRITSSFAGGGGGEAARAGSEATASAVAAPAYETALVGVVPNPFSRSAAVQFTLAEPAEVRLAVYDGLGREVARLADGWLDAGWHTARFDGAALPSGVYLVRMEARGAAGAFTESGRITLVK